jgi:hypothetical protein
MRDFISGWFFPVVKKKNVSIGMGVADRGDCSTGQYSNPEIVCPERGP